MAKRGYLGRLLGSMGGTSRSSRRTQQPPSNRPSRREPERLNPPPKNGWKIVTIVVGLLTFGGLSIAGIMSGMPDWALIPLGFSFGCAYFAIQIGLGWKKDRQEDLGELLKPVVQRGRQRKDVQQPQFEEYTMSQHVRELGSNAVKMLTHPRVISTVNAVGLGMLVHAWFDSLWITIPVGIIAALLLLIPADIVSALRTMSKEERHAVYARWTESFLDAMAMTAFASPEGCGPEMTEYVLQRYRERAAQQKEDATS